MTAVGLVEAILYATAYSFPLDREIILFYVTILQQFQKYVVGLWYGLLCFSKMM